MRKHKYFKRLGFLHVLHSSILSETETMQFRKDEKTEFTK